MGKSELERLTQATGQAREAITDARGVIEDIGRARSEFRQWIDSELKGEIRRQLDVLAQATTEAIDQNVAQINGRFHNLAGLLLGVHGMGLTVEDLRRMLGDPEFAARARAAFGALVRDQVAAGGRADDDS